MVRASDVDDELAAVSAAVEVRGRLAHRHAHVASHAETLSPERAHAMFSLDAEKKKEN